MPLRPLGHGPSFRCRVSAAEQGSSVLQSLELRSPKSHVSHESNVQLGHHYKASNHYFCRKIPLE